MAKTTSQIIAENKIKRAEAAAIAASRDKIHQQQMAGVAEKAAARTLAVLNKAISGTSDSTKKSELSRAAQMVTDEYKKASTQNKTGPKTATDMQKKKEDRIEEKSQVDSLQIRKDRAEKALKDFDDNKEIDWTDTNQRKQYDAERKRLQAEVDRAGAEIDARADAKTHDANMAVIDAMSDEDRATLEEYVRERDERDDPLTVSNPFRFVLQNKKVSDNYSVLVEKYGEDQLKKLAETYGRSLHEQDAKKIVEDTTAAVDNVPGAIGHNILSVGASGIGGVLGTLGRVNELFSRTGQYRTLENYTPGDALNLYAGTVRGATAQNIEGEDGGTGRKVLSLGYQGIMTLADSISRSLALGPAGGAALAATSSFSQTVSEATKQGASPQQAVALGVATAGMEYVSEKIPMDEVFKLAKAGDTKVLAQAFKQAGVEITTEELSLFGSMAAEAAILQEKSSYRQQIGDLVANGASYEEAKAQADKGVWNEVLQTAAVSGFAGGFSGGGAAVVGNLATNNAPEVTEEIQQEQPVQTPPAAPVVEPAQQTGPFAEQLLEGIQDMTPAPAPLTEEQQHFDNAAAIANGMEPEQKTAIEATGEQHAQMMPKPEPVVKTEAEQRLDNAMAEAFGLEPERINVDSAGIEANMDQETRGNVLASKTVNVVEDTQSAAHLQDIKDIESLPAKAKSKVEKIIRPLAEKLGILNRNLKSPAVEVEFQFSKNKGLKDSLSKQLRYGGSYGDFAKALTNLDKILQSAVLIEKHRDKYAGTVREDRRLESVSVLLGACRDGDSIIPVQMEIKKSSQNGGQLYITVAMTKIEADVLGSAVGESQGRSLISASKYNLPELFSKINPADKHFLKYVPDGMLSDQQKQAKQSALLEDFERVAGYERTDGKSRADVRSIFEGYGLHPENPQAADTLEPSAEGGQDIKGTGAAERNFTGSAAYDELLSDDNVQREREGDGRYIEVPKKDADGKIVSEFVGNSMNSALTPESFTNNIKKLVQEGKVSHDVQTNEESLRKAAQAIAEDCKNDKPDDEPGDKPGSVYKSVRKVTEFAASGKTSPEDIAKATLLYQHLTEQLDQQRQQGNVDSDLQHQAEDVYIALSQMATSSGRAMQLFNLFRKMTPEGQVNILRKEVAREIEKLQNRGVVKKDYQHSVDQELLDDYKEAAERYLKADSPKSKTEAEAQMQEIQNEIYLSAAASLPTTFKAKWDAWRYMAMLGNAKTQIRNFMGNALMMPYTDIKRTVGALMEKGIQKSDRTKAVFQDKELLKWARQDSATDLVKGALENSAKLGDDMTQSAIGDNLRIFKNGLLEGARKVTNNAVSAGDMLFKNREYAVALAGFIKARGYSITDVQSGKVSQDILNEARNYAIEEALKATFNDSNALSDTLVDMRFKNPDNVVKKAVNLLGEGLLPFRKTPANVVMRFKDYSPAGLVQGLWNAAFNVRNGKVSAATAIDQLASGLTGTAAAALGYALAGGLCGIKLTGSGTDEDEQRQGHQNYALEFSIGGKTYSYKIDWASPANLPLFLGANLRAMTESEDTASFLTALLNMGMGAMEPLLQLSCMSSLNDLVEGVRYAGEGEALYTIASKMATSYFMQGVPSVLRQAAQAIPENKQTTFVTSDDPVIQKAQKTAANLPFVGNAYKTDKVDAWGQKEEQGNWMFRTFNAFVNPGTLKEIDNGALETEIARLNQAQSENISPPTAAKVISYTDKNGNTHTDVRLTEEQYQTLARVQGETSAQVISKMIESADYAALSDEQKAEAIKTVYAYAKEKAEIAAVPDHYGYSESWMKAMPKGHEGFNIIARTAAKSLNGAAGDLQTAWSEGWEDKSYSDDMQWAYDTFTDLKKSTQKTVLKQLEGMTANYIEARSEGISHEDFLDVSKLLEGITPQKGYTNPRDVQKAETIASYKGISEDEKALLIKQQVSESQSENLDQMQELGYSAEDYANVLRVYRDIYDSDSKSKKDDFIAQLTERYGMTKAEAKAVYDIYK